MPTRHIYKFFAGICLLLLLNVVPASAEIRIIERRLIKTLEQTGVEDVAIEQTNDVLRIAYNDNVYRGTIRGTFEIIKLLLNDFRELHTDVRIILQENSISQVVILIPAESLERYNVGELTLSGVMSTLAISHNTDSDEKWLQKKKRENRSAGKVDFVLYPQISLRNSWFDKLYGTVINIAPAVEVKLWKGASFTGQVIFPLWNNMKGEMDYIRAGMLVFRQEYRFPHNIYSTFSIGNFNQSRIGADLSTRYVADNGRWGTGFNIGLTGSSTFYEGQWEVTRWKRVSGDLSLQYNEPNYNMQFELTAARYIYGDYGVRLDCSRHFGEVSIGFYAMYSGGEPNGGFHFSIPLSRKKMAKRKAVRVRLPEYFDWEYEAQSGNEYATKRLGRYYETRPDENRSQRYYNPDFMKKTLLRLAEE